MSRTSKRNTGECLIQCFRSDGSFSTETASKASWAEMARWANLEEERQYRAAFHAPRNTNVKLDSLDYGSLDSHQTPAIGP